MVDIRTGKNEGVMPKEHDTSTIHLLREEQRALKNLTLTVALGAGVVGADTYGAVSQLLNHNLIAVGVDAGLAVIVGGVALASYLLQKEIIMEGF